MKTPRFIYFDLGKVIVDYSTEKMCKQMAEVSEVDAEAVRKTVFQDGLQWDYETGKLTSREFYETYCERIGRRPDYQRVWQAIGDIFSLKVPTLPLVAQLSHAGYPLGILSNTCECHWQYCVEKYRFLTECFQTYALSHRIGALKPAEKIYLAAAKLAGCRPEEIFFVDDLSGHVAGAKAVGIDAIVFTSALELANELRRRGLKFNY